MNRRRQDALTAIRITSDQLSILGAWLGTYALRFYAFEAPKGTPGFFAYAKLLPFILVIWFFVFFSLGFYNRTSHFRSALVEGAQIVRGTIVALFVFLSFTYFYDEYRYSRGVILIFAVLHPFTIMLGRSTIRKLLRWYRNRVPARKTLVISSISGLKIALELSSLGEIARADIRGVIMLEDLDLETREFLSAKKIAILSKPNNWSQFFNLHPTQTVVFSLSSELLSEFEKDINEIANLIVDVKLVPELELFKKFSSSIELISGTPVIVIHESQLAGLGTLAKRIIDIVGSTCAIVVFLPFFLIISVVIKLTSRGPIFFRQERMGLDNVTFQMLKFRSMPLNAEVNTGAIFSSPQDNRATSVGKLIRKTSLDEIPQFFNVLKGEMSLVGPRPERPFFVDKFKQEIPNYMIRHKVKSGITGWAQVNGWRGDTSIQARIDCDLYYIQHWSILFDLKILTQTILKGFFNKNAY